MVLVQSESAIDEAPSFAAKIVVVMNLKPCEYHGLGKCARVLKKPPDALNCSQDCRSNFQGGHAGLQLVDCHIKTLQQAAAAMASAVGACSCLPLLGAKAQHHLASWKLHLHCNPRQRQCGTFCKQCAAGLTCAAKHIDMAAQHEDHQCFQHTVHVEMADQPLKQQNHYRSSCISSMPGA